MGPYAVRVATVALDFTLPRVDGDPVSLTELLADGPVVFVFAHADCPTSALTLRRLGELDGAARIVCIAEEHPEEAARLARRTHFSHPMLAQQEPYEVSQALGAALEARMHGALGIRLEGHRAGRLRGHARARLERRAAGGAAHARARGGDA